MERYFICDIDSKKEWQHFKLKRCHSGLFGAIAAAGHAVGAVGSSDGAFSGCLPGKLEFIIEFSFSILLRNYL